MDADRGNRADTLFGEIALRLGILTAQQLDEALEIQKSLPERRPLGMILMDRNYVTQPDLERILAAQRRMVDQVVLRAQAAKEDSLFGKVALRMNFCGEEQLRECLMIQEQLPAEHFMRLGDIMVIKGYLRVEQVQKVLEMQQGLILSCPSCKTSYNVVMFRPGASLQCYHCGSPLRVPLRLTSPDIDEAIYFGEGE